MFYMLKSNIMFRNYESFGYITDNRNFGYIKSDGDGGFIGDKIVSKSGSIFLSALCQYPQHIDEIVKKIKLIFNNIETKIITNDAKDFYNTLEQDGFIASGNTEIECKDNDWKFSYELLESRICNGRLDSNKITVNTDTQEFFENFFQNEYRLTNLHIEITGKCNERCIHCYLPGKEKAKHIDTRLFNSILEQCRDLKVLHVTLTGGEPMLHPDFILFIKKCKEYNISVNILSNLTLLNEEIIKEMKTNGLLSIQTSLYSTNKDVHDSITNVKGSFELTKKSILKIIENNIPIQISCPIIKQNKNYYKDVLNWAKNHNIYVGYDYVIIGDCKNTMKNLSCRLSIDDVEEIIRDRIEIDGNYLDELRIECEEKKKSKPDDIVCSVCHSSFCISENGNVYPCAGWHGYVIGNANNMSLNDIWNGSKNIQYLRNLRKKDFPKCIKCSDKDYCTMCMVRNANENQSGNPLAVNDFYCKIAKINRCMIQNSQDNYEIDNI